MPAVSPQARFRHAIDYDPVRQRVVLFGGTTNGGGDLTDTWEWDGMSWVKRSPTASPQGSVGAMTYDASAGKILDFDGSSLFVFLP